MSLRQYEYALAIAAEGSVTAAAELLRVAQPSVSQQIRSLERDLGVELFARTPTGLVPTSVGRAFLREAEVAVSAARRARAMARAGCRRAGGRTGGRGADGPRHAATAGRIGRPPPPLPAVGGHRIRGAELRGTGAVVPPGPSGPHSDGGVRAEPRRATTWVTRSSSWSWAPGTGASPRTGSSYAT